MKSAAVKISILVDNQAGDGLFRSRIRVLKNNLQIYRARQLREGECIARSASSAA